MPVTAVDGLIPTSISNLNVYVFLVNVFVMVDTDTSCKTRYLSAKIFATYSTGNLTSFLFYVYLYQNPNLSLRRYLYDRMDGQIKTRNKKWSIHPVIQVST